MSEPEPRDDLADGESADPGTFGTSAPDGDRLDRLRTMLEETRLRIVQQLLAHDSGALSVEELAYRNADVADRTIDYHLRTLEDAGVVTRLKVEDGRNDLPNTYWAVTTEGVEALQRLGFYDEIEVLSQADDALDRTDRIREIEAYDRRPEPDWY